MSKERAPNTQQRATDQGIEYKKKSYSIFFIVKKLQKSISDCSIRE